jgi:hypothetical protein
MKKIAAIITSYFPYSHADVILSKFMKGIPTDEGLREPRVELASIYLDQIDARDIGQSLAWRHGVPIFPSIRAALSLGGAELAVDGVLLIGEHGDYPTDEQGRHMYPRRAFFEQIAGVFARGGRSVPVFNDKHLSYNWPDARWMYERAQQLQAPLLAGSSLPLCWRRPFLEYERETAIEAAVAIGYGGVESYGFHALETLQCMVERRRGGETGVAAVQCLEGEADWEAGRQDRWSRLLAEAGCAAIEKKPDGTMDSHCREPAGLAEGRVQATEFFLQRDFPHGHFNYLALNIEEMVLSGTSPYPAERTLLTTGILDAVMTSRHLGHTRVETPHLEISYLSYEATPWRPSGPRPAGANCAVWPPPG